MKKMLLAILALGLATTVNCLAGDDMSERALKLAAALNIPTNGQARVSKSDVFAEGKASRVGGFKMNMKRVVQITPIKVTEVDILDASDRVVATGRITEGSSFETAREALLEQLVSNSMPIDYVIAGLELQTNEIGDFCIFPKSSGRSKGEDVNVMSIHFVRGIHAVSLWAMRGVNMNMWPLAKALDMVMSDALGIAKP